jgi:N-acetylglucosamine kinase-like BadF-type ATPase
MPSHNASQLCLGVDGGGTKSMAWLGRDAAAHLQVVGRGVAGPSNPRSVGYETAFSNITDAVLNAFADAGLAPTAVATACLCIAGVGRAGEKQRVIEWAAGQGIAQGCFVASDAEAVLAAGEQRALTANEGDIALIAGTGSIAWARNASHEMHRCGGWGYLIDDLGSGYSIGREALTLACQTADGRASEANLLQGLLTRTACKEPQDLIDWAYGSEQPRQKIASLAPFVFDMASRSTAAQSIIARGASELAELVATLANKLCFESYSLKFAGSVLCSQSEYAAQVARELAARNQTPASIAFVREPVSGALNLAHLAMQHAE